MCLQLPKLLYLMKAFLLKRMKVQQVPFCFYDARTSLLFVKHLPLYHECNFFCLCCLPSVKRHSIFVGNLPLDATPDQLDAAFKRFGSIKPNGIQVRSSKVRDCTLVKNKWHAQISSLDVSVICETCLHVAGLLLWLCRI